MKTPLNWISLFTDINGLLKSEGTSKLAHLYSIHTAEIDAIEKYGQENKVIVGKVIDAKPHPDSDHLNVVQVSLGTIGDVQIVCGANNVVGAKYVPVATVGAVLKGDFEIKAARLRGQESNGMICSEDELDFQEARAPGIMRLEEYFDVELLEANIGKPFFDIKIQILGFDSQPYESALRDVVFEIDNKFITNRPDLFSVEGNAREFSAIFDLPFTPYKNSYTFKNRTLNVNILTEKVLSYHLIKMNDVHAAESPFPIKYALYKSGINPKFDLVDMTNYVMTELGQPMHAFDADKIVGDVTVRAAKKGERVLALNGETYELDERDTVIADDVKILAIGGIMGGQDSAISETTKNVLIESACFDASSIRLSSQRLGVRTDSSARYEKSLDPLLTYRALERALEFLRFLGKSGELISDFEYLNKDSLKDANLILDPKFIAKKIGIVIPEADIERILVALGFDFSKQNSDYSVRVPSWRVTKDISIKEDLAEEIGRIYGYERVPEIPLVGEQVVYSENRSVAFRQGIQNYFAGKGWFEAYNYSFSNESSDSKIGLISIENAIKVVNAYSNEFTLMRRKMIGNLLSNVTDNKKIEDSFSFFEISKVECKQDGEFKEESKIAGISYSVSFESFKSDVIGLIDSVMSGLDFSIRQGVKLEDYPYLHPNKSGEFVTADGKVIGHFGFVNPQVATNFDLDDSKLCYFELDFATLLNLSEKSDFRFREISKYPGTTREFNFVMREKTPVGDIVSLIKRVNPLVRSVKIADIYRNEEKLGHDMKSVTFAAYLQDYEKTITDEDSMNAQNSIINELSKIGIELRK